MLSRPHTPSAAAAELTTIFRRLETHLGLELRPRDRRRVEQGVAQRMRSLRLTELSDYLPHLATDAEFNTLIRYATIAESWFFRDSGQMRLIRHLLLPELIASRRSRRRLRIWSAGCASGQEAWSLAMLVADALPSASRWDVLILGTDINAEALASASAGVYTGWSLRGLNEANRERFFTRSGEGWRIADPLRRWVDFRSDNLVEGSPPPIQDVDLVLCRNVLIYLQRERLSAVMTRFGAALRSQGLLVTGHCELLDVATVGFEPQHFPEGLVYRRSSATRQAAPNGAIAAAKKSLPPPQGPVGLQAQGGSPRSRLGQPAAQPGRQGSTGSATRTTRAACAPAPDPQTDLVAAAEARAARGDYAGATEIARQAQHAATLDHRPIYLLAQLAEIEGDHAEALRKLAQVLYLAPDFIPACLDTAAHLERLGNLDRAMRHRRAARRLLESQPDERAMQPPYQCMRIGALKTYLDELLNAADAEQDMIGSDAEHPAEKQAL